MSIFESLHTRAYDLVVGSRLFNKIIWKNDIINYKNFVSKIIDDQPAGSKIIDIPCGPLTFTADIYANDKKHQILLLDISPTALKIAQKRLKRLGAGQNIRIIKADARTLPFEPKSIDLILSLGFLHIFKQTQAIDIILEEFYKVLKPNALIGFQILALSHSFSDIFLKTLNFIGQIGPPKKTEFYLKLLEKHNFKTIKTKQIGTMLYIVAKKQ